MKKEELKKAMFFSANILGLIKTYISEQYYLTAIKEASSIPGEDKAILHGKCIGLHFAMGEISEMIQGLVEKSKLIDK